MNISNNPPQHGEGVDDVWVHSDGRWWGSDDHGEFPLLAGSPHPVEKGDWNEFKDKELKYHPCNRVLKFTFERYGERRWCTGISNGAEDVCKHHKARLDMEKQHKENFKTGAFTESYETIFRYLPPHKQILANELYRSLMEESVYDFAESFVDRDINTEEWEDMEDTAQIMHPVPEQHESRCMALWFAALDFVVMQNIRQEQFRVAFEEDTAVGEKEFEQEAESGQVYMIIDEHHLNLGLSRVQKDYKEHLKFGGVPLQTDLEDTDTAEREWVIEIQPEGEVSDSRHDDILTIEEPSRED